MTSNLTPAEHRQLRSLFHLVDRDQSGSITKQELASLLHTLNSPRSARPTYGSSQPTAAVHPQLALPTSSDAIDSLIAECDTNNDGEIDYSEFATVMSRRAGSKYSREEVLDAMRVFEPRSGGAGQLSVELLERAVRMLDVGGVELRGGTGSGSGGSGAADSAEGVVGVEEKRRQMLDMLDQLKVNYGGRFAYEQVGAASPQSHTAQQLLTARLKVCLSRSHVPPTVCVP